MSRENVELVRQTLLAWNQHDLELLRTYMAPEIEWLPAGPAAVERTVYRGQDEAANGFAAIWETWEAFQFEETEVRDLGDSVLWLGRVQMKGGTSQIELIQEFANHFSLRDGKIARAEGFLSWQDGLQAAGLSE